MGYHQKPVRVIRIFRMVFDRRSKEQDEAVGVVFRQEVSRDALHQREAGLGIRLSGLQEREELFLLFFAGIQLVDQIVLRTRQAGDGEEKGC